MAVIATVTVVTAAVTTYNSVKSHNQQSEQIRNQQSSYERNAEVQTGVNTAPTNLRAPSGPNDKGKFSYYNAKDKKVVTFTDAAAYYEYKKLCEELDKLDQNLAISIVHNTLDVLGVIPGYGEIADATNGLIYLAEGDYLMLGGITELLNEVIADPESIQIPKSDYEESQEIKRLNAEISKELNTVGFDKEAIKQKMLTCVSEKYMSLGTEEVTAQSLKDIFKDTPPLTAYDSDLTDQAVSGIQLKENGTISLVLINGQRIGKEKSA